MIDPLKKLLHDSWPCGLDQVLQVVEDQNRGRFCKLCPKSRIVGPIGLNGKPYRISDGQDDADRGSNIRQLYESRSFISRPADLHGEPCLSDSTESRQG